MATKLELMAESERFDRIAEAARVVTARYDFRNAVKIALECLPSLLGKLQYEKRYCQNPLPALTPLEIIFNFAPTYFLFQALDTVETHLDEDKRLEKASDHDLRVRLEYARAAMATALMLWDRIVEGLAVTSVVEPIQKGITEDWMREGIISIVHRDHIRIYSLALDLNSPWLGKCECCGVKVQGAKIQFLNVKRCPGCRGLGQFVLVSPITQ